MKCVSSVCVCVYVCVCVWCLKKPAWNVWIWGMGDLQDYILVYIWVCVSVCVCVYVCVHACVYYVWVFWCVCMYVYVCMHVCMRVYLCECVCMLCLLWLCIMYSCAVHACVTVCTYPWFKHVTALHEYIFSEHMFTRIHMHEYVLKSNLNQYHTTCAVVFLWVQVWTCGDGSPKIPRATTQKASNDGLLQCRQQLWKGFESVGVKTSIML